MVGKVTPDSMLSASRLPAVLGLSKYRTPNDELLVSIDAMNGKQRQDITNEAMTWGNELESIILRQTAERLQLTDMKLDHPKPFFHPTLPLCCSLDGLADGRGQILRTTRCALQPAGQAGEQPAQVCCRRGWADGPPRDRRPYSTTSR